MEPDFNPLQYADVELENGDFVTLSRRCYNGTVEERLMTFSGVEITRIQNYADYAAAFRKSEKDS